MPFPVASTAVVSSLNMGGQDHKVFFQFPAYVDNRGENDQKRPIVFALGDLPCERLHDFRAVRM